MLAHVWMGGGGGGWPSCHAIGDTTILGIPISLYLTPSCLNNGSKFIFPEKIELFFSILPDVFFSIWSANLFAAALHCFAISIKYNCPLPQTRDRSANLFTMRDIWDF